MNFDPNNYNELTVTESPIPGLFVVKLPVHGDNRGWFKENYQKEKNGSTGTAVIYHRAEQYQLQRQSRRYPRSARRTVE